jgi:hypothetical protein
LPIRSRFRAASRAVCSATPILLALLTITGCFDDSTSPKTGNGASNPASPGSQAPRISGAPAPSAKVGVPYVFVPVASDPNNDPLKFTISGLPSWMTFSPGSGQIYGVPGAANIGQHEGIQIRVTDGVSTVSLPRFSITVNPATTGSATLRWVAPTKTTNGKLLSGLAGFRIYYGLTSPKSERVLTVKDPSATRVTISNLGTGTWYFAVAAYTRAGVESARSNVVLKSI